MRISAALTPTGFACASVLAACWACSDPEAQPSRAPAAAGTAARAAAAAPEPVFDPSPAREPRAWFPGRVQKLAPWGEALRARMDPRRDGWGAEAVCARAEVQLARALESALRRDGDASLLRALGTSELSIARELVPTSRETVLADDVLRAEEVRLFPPADDLADALAGWRAALDTGSDPRCEVALETWTASADGRIEADVFVRASSLGSRRVQTTLELASTWVITDGAARLARVEPRTATVVEALEPVFVDATRGVLGRERWFASDILVGTDRRHMRRDRLGIDPFLGMQGIAIGDIDGDGLEDVYVCQSTGLPNRLLLHAVDGTARDGAVAAGVAFLDGCSAAFFADLDQDGDEDLAVATGNALLLAWNDGRGLFSEGSVLRAPDAPEIYSIVAADVDLDGDLDIYACRYVEGGVIGGAPAPYHDAHNGAKNVFWRNEGDRRFREATAEVGLDAGNDRFSLAAAFDDFDDDGDADLYVTNDFGRNNLYENVGGRFVDVASRSDAEDVAASMGAAVADVDLDGDLDVYVTNMESPIGARVAASERFLVDRPHERPAYVRHARGNTLLAGVGGLSFECRLETSGARRGGWAWGSTFSDWNSDGLPDLFVPNGFITGSRVEDVESFFWRVLVASTPTAPPPSEAYLRSWEFLRHMTLVEGYSWNGRERDDAYLNVGGGRFVDASRALGIDFPDDGRSVVHCDWDGDLREDLWVGSRTGTRLRLLLANAAHADSTQASRSVAFELVGTRSNRQGIGATVFVEAGGRTLRGSARVGDGFLSSSSKRIVIGLGDALQVDTAQSNAAPTDTAQSNAAPIDSVRVRWPGGTLESFTGVTPGALWRLVEGSGRGVEKPIARARPSTESSPWTPDPGFGIGRIVLDDRLPAGLFELPDREGRTQRVEAFAGRPLLVGVGRVNDPESAELAAVLAARPSDSEIQGTATWMLVLAEPGQDANTRRWLDQHGSKVSAGPLDARGAQALEVLLVEILGPFDKIPLPLVLAIDRGGSIALVRCGPVSTEALWADARGVARLDPNARGTESLVGGGRWARVPERSLGPVGEVFERLGRPDWAAWYRERARTRGGH